LASLLCRMISLIGSSQSLPPRSASLILCSISCLREAREFFLVTYSAVSSTPSLSSPMFYLSEYFESHRKEYYDRLSAVSNTNDWEGWITYFMEAVVEQSKKNIEKAQSIHALYDKKKDRIVNATHSQFSIKVLDFLFTNPIFTGTQFAHQSDIPKPSTTRILRLLSENGIVKQISPAAGRKPALYIFPKLLAITS